ncbi:FtsX-like permease family protein [Telmatospirillum sp.]|uniref:FtsX-like permease family protein n=1 Tax=Telmatospirillum sp. TaxID=2079197 RepID=UPI00284A2138|nr:FtsX-like permease family protein [Telmatospirillum sp.]MDR3436882.1 ABC transporter permease [Telmatospirillum sp.]
MTRFHETLANAYVRTDQTGIGVSFLLVLMGALVLGVASLNYANLAAAQAAGRLRESGMRILLGATRRQIILQNLVESAVLAIGALVLVLVILAVLTAPLAGATGINLATLLFGRVAFWSLLVAGVTVATAVGGLYPAILLSGWRAKTAARGGKTKQAASRLATLFVGIQFLVTSLLLVMVVVMFLQNAQLRRVVSPSGGGALLAITTSLKALPVKIDDIRTVLRDVPEVLGVAAASTIPWTLEVSSGSLFPTQELGTRRVEAYINGVTDDYFSTIGARVLAGRDFSSERGGDVMPESLTGNDGSFNVIVDRSLAQAFGWSPEAAVGRTIYRQSTHGAAPFQIVGVVEDRPQHFLGVGSRGNLYCLSLEAAHFPIIRVADGAPAAAVAAIDAALARLAPQTPFQHRFSLELFEENAEILTAVAAIFGVLAVFAISIAVLGLSGMAIQTTSGRLQEIAIRKILGASYGAVLRLLLWDLSRPVLIATVVSWPIAYVCGQAYLSLFTQRTTLGVLPFVASLSVTIIVAWMAVGWQIVAAARRDPADILRYE